MYRRPNRKLAARNVALIIAMSALAGGCTQAVRHSNTMVFGTNTTVGLKVGTDAMQIPAVEVGYNRQEAVIMPLLANTAVEDDGYHRLIPCNPGFVGIAPAAAGNGNPPPKAAGGTNANANTVHPCLFVATRSEGQHKSAQDSYSVLASFGAEIAGDAKGGTGSVGLAQYFATGLAAQLLAATGGAAVVAVGQAAENSAANPNIAAASAAVTGNTPTYPPGSGTATSDARDALVDKLATMSDQDVINRAPAFIAGLGFMDDLTKNDFSSECAKGQSACKKFVEDNPNIFIGLNSDYVNKL